MRITLAFLALTLAAMCPFAARCDTFPRTLGASSDFIGAVTLDPSGNILVAGTAYSGAVPVTNGSRNPGTQLSVSTDHGASWAPLANLPAGLPNALAFSPSAPAIVYAAGSAGIFRSTNRGATWTATTLTSPALSVAADYQSPSGVFAGTTAGIFHSTDAGATWTNISANFPSLSGNFYQPLYLVLDPFHPNVILAGTNLIDVRSTDGGSTWIPYALPGAGNAVHIAPVFDPLRPGVIYIGDTWGLLRSTDNGQTWSVLDVPAVQPQAIAVPASAPGNIWVCGFDGLIHRSTDNGQTFTLIQPTSNQLYWGMAVDPSQTAVVLTYYFRTADNGASWQSSTLGRPGTYTFDPGVPGRVIAIAGVTSDAFVAKLDPTGQTVLFATYLGGLGADYATGIATDPSGNFYVTGGTTSAEFPSTGPAFAPVPLGATGDSFAAKFDPSGNLLYSVPIPIATNRAIAADPQGNAYLTGPECTVIKLSPDGARTLWTTNIPNASGCLAIAVAPNGSIAVAGSNRASTFDAADGLLARLDSAGAILSVLPLGGSSNDAATALTFDPQSNLYVTGNTSSADFPVTTGAYQTVFKPACPFPTGVTGFRSLPTYITANAFVIKFDADANVVYSTYLGGNCLDTATSIAVDPAGNAWIAGNSDSTTLPQVWPVDDPPQYGFAKAFVARLAESGAWLWRSSFLPGGIPTLAADPLGNAYVTTLGATLLKIAPH